jgi:DNA-binding protein HU-beta
MNKAELVSAIAKRADVPASTVDSVLAGLQEELVDAITRGEKVAVSGLLTVERTQRSARTGRNPQTGESIDIPAANTVKVTAGSNLKKAASAVPPPSGGCLTRVVRPTASWVKMRVQGAVRRRTA